MRVGITDYAQDALGDIVYVPLPEVGAEVDDGTAVGELESTKSVSDVYAPLGGDRQSPATRRSTPPPSWSTPTRTARAGSSRSCRRTPLRSTP